MTFALQIAYFLLENWFWLPIFYLFINVCEFESNEILKKYNASFWSQENCPSVLAVLRTALEAGCCGMQGSKMSGFHFFPTLLVALRK